MTGSIILLIILIFLNAVFASAEIAVISMNETKLKYMVENGDKRAKKLASLTEQPARFLATIQVAITLSGFLNSAFAADNFSGPLVQLLIRAGIPVPESVLRSIAFVVITLVLSYFNIVLGELVPKRIAMKKSESLALALASLLYWVARIFAPLVSLLTVSTNGILRFIGISPEEEEDRVTEEEIRMMLTEGNAQGVIDEQENTFIQNVFEFDDLSAEQICTHRTDVAVLDVTQSLEEWDEMIHEYRHTCYPVCQDSKENIIGVLDTRDYFRLSEKTRESLFEKAVKPPFFVPENIKTDTLFERMKQNRNYFSILLDEYGGMSGIVTLHDLMEALVGDIYDADDEDDGMDIRQLSETTWLIRGDADLDDVGRALHVKLPDDEADTFNGFVYTVIDLIPEDGSSFTCKYENLVIHVRDVKRHKIVDAYVEVLEEPEQEKED